MRPQLVIIDQLQPLSPPVSDILFNVDIKNYLISIDPNLQTVFNRVSTDVFRGLPKTPYVALIGTVIGQIVRYTQAKSIRSNLYLLCGAGFTIDIITNLTDEQWNYIGLSMDKVNIIQNINRYLIQTNNGLTCAEDIRKLKQVSGVGNWTIETTILTAFLDWDTFPSGDLFIRKRIKKLYNMFKVPTISETKQIAEKWSPYRSVVAWYLWRWFD